MTIKVQCECGTRYSFDVEPRNGAMPHRVNCPACNADGTAAANQIIAQAAAESQPRLRVQGSMPPAPAPVADAIPVAPILAVPKPASGATLEKMRAEARQTRRMLLAAAGVLLLICTAVGVWAWYGLVLSKPRLIYKFDLPLGTANWRTVFVDKGRALFASPARVVLHDLSARKDIWSTLLPGVSGGDADGPAPDVFVNKTDAWLCAGGQVVRIDLISGRVKGTIPVTGTLASFTPADSSILVVSATGETTRVAMRIDLASGEASSQRIEVPRAQKHAMPDELPPNVAPTAGVLLAQATEEQKFNKPLDAVSSEFFSAGQNLVELRVRLLEPKVTWIKSIKPKGPSLINGNTTAATPAGAVAEEVFNDIKRDQTGGVKSIDESTYEVRLRRWIEGKPVEWKGNVSGVPAFFSLPTVDLVVAGKSLTAFDKQNNKLFESQLSYPISDRFGADDFDHAIPAVERKGALYFFDQGVLTAFGLPGGQVQWRLISVGISQAQFDDEGSMYVDSTASAPEDIQYSDQIKIEKTPPVILKVNPQNGKILWQAENVGQHCYLSGKFVYTVSVGKGGVGLANGLAEALHTPQQEGPVFFHIYRLDPETGQVMWNLFRNEAPDEQAFQQNWFVLRYGAGVQAWNFLQL